MRHQASAGLLVAVISIGWSARAQDAPHLSITQPGGMPGMPILTGIARATNGVNVTWDGPSGYYQLFQKPSLTAPAWQPIGTPFNIARNATVTNLSRSAFLRVSGPPASYAAAQTCVTCHEDVFDTVVHTAHFGAFSNALFASLGGQTNAACLACHTVGSGLRSGFVSQAVTPQLAGVQCENCHGPAGNHAANPDDPVTRPRVELAGTMCGGCHNQQLLPPEVLTNLNLLAFHPPQYEGWSATPHQSVTTAVKAGFMGSQAPMSYISDCGRCHSGTVREAQTEGDVLPSGLEASAVGVACATCHDPHEPVVKTNLLSGAFCGDCHNSSVPAGVTTQHPPYYEEWSASPHHEVLPELQADFASAPSLISTCGRCHSGTVREAFLENQVLPGAQEASAVGIACATCHDPHEQFIYTNVLSGVITNPVTGDVVTNGQAGSTYATQLRNPVSSVQDYHTTGNFATNYNPQINVCAQCHNDRGATYTATDRPPHQSLQYNMLLGTVGVPDPSNPDAKPSRPASHALFLTNQCVGCHMQTAPYVSPAQPAVAGHHFTVDSFDTCLQCHPFPEGLADFIMGSVSNEIQQVVALLDYWATTKGQTTFGTTNYGASAWEYSNPGALSPGVQTNAAPQDKIPLNIKIARFNTYLVLNDGSFGVHNGLYTDILLTNAVFCVRAELNK